MKIPIKDFNIEYLNKDQDIKIKKKTIRNKLDKVKNIIQYNYKKYKLVIYNSKALKNINYNIYYEDIIDKLKEDILTNMILNEIDFSGYENIKREVINQLNKKNIESNTDLVNNLVELIKIKGIAEYKKIDKKYCQHKEALDNIFYNFKFLLNSITCNDYEIVLKSNIKLKELEEYNLKNMNEYFNKFREDMNDILTKSQIKGCYFKYDLNEEKKYKICITYDKLFKKIFDIKNYIGGNIILNYNNKIHTLYFKSNNKLINHLFDKTNELKWLERELIYGSNCSVLISGYRGVGKTTSILNLTDDVKNIKKTQNSKYKHTISININLNNITNYSDILRGIIREIYWELSNSEIYIDLKKLYPEFAEKMDLLYDKTFFDIQEISNNRKSRNIEKNINITMDIVYIASIIIVILTSKINSHLKIKIIPIITGIYGVIKILNIAYSRKYENNKTDEIKRSSLFDNEIAEFQLKDILLKLKNLEGNETKVIFIIDEIDKLDLDNQNEVINKFKSLIHSRLGSFIFICGQQLYYRFIEDEQRDNSVMSSIFDNSIHISIATHKELRLVFKEYIGELSYKNNKKIIDGYVDSLLLKSNCIIRKFNTIISNSIIRESGGCYIKIDENDSYELDTLIINSIEKTINKYIDSKNYDKAIRDFFVQQLYLWGNKIKIKSRFKSYEDINTLNNFDDYNFLKDYMKSVKEVFDKFKEELIQNEILTVIKEDSQEEYVINNKFIKYYDLREEKNEYIRLKKLFLNSMDIIEQYADYLSKYKDLNHKNKMELLETNIKDIVKNYSILNLNKDVFNIYAESICIYYKLKDKYYLEIDNKEFEVISKSIENNIRDLMFEILSTFIKSIINEYITNLYQRKYDIDFYDRIQKNRNYRYFKIQRNGNCMYIYISLNSKYDFLENNEEVNNGKNIIFNLKTEILNEIDNDIYNIDIYNIDIYKYNDEVDKCKNYIIDKIENKLEQLNKEYGFNNDLSKLKELIELNPDDKKNYIFKANWHSKLKQYKEAKYEYSRGIGINLEFIDTISCLRYNGESAKGKISIFSDHSSIIIYMNSLSNKDNCDEFKENTIRLNEKIRIEDFKAVRKLLEMSSIDGSLISDGRYIYGLENMNNYKNGLLGTINFTGYFSYEIIEPYENSIIKFRNGNAEFIGEEENNKINEIKSRVKLLFSKEISNLEEIINTLKNESNGTTIIITEEVENEVKRLQYQSTIIKPTIIDYKMIKQISSIDGSILIDTNGICYAIGVILDGASMGWYDPRRGPRYNSVLKYINAQIERGVKSIAIVISEDGMVDIIDTYNLDKIRQDTDNKS